MSATHSQSVKTPMPIGQHRVLPWATKHGMLVAGGLLTYVANFFLLAIGDFGRLSGPLCGWFCSEFAVVSPFSEDWRSLLHERPIEYFSILGSGLVNPLFLTGFFLHLFRARRGALIVLRTLTILVIPLCGVVFLYERFYPREGHILWIAGMLLALFAMPGLNLRPPKEQSA